ncbi:MAG TPA: hypothetical protein VFP31_00930 [Gaiellaceae bacterium]|nr:hypothetical protein [Gaiellaceae bacterium]
MGAGEGLGDGVGVAGVPGFDVGGFGAVGRLIGIARGALAAALVPRETRSRTTGVAGTG